MTHDNKRGLPDTLDGRPDGIVTLVDVLFVMLATVAGVAATMAVATLVAGLAPGAVPVAVFVAWPFGFVGTVLALRVGSHAVARSGVLEAVRDVATRVRTPETAATDGGYPDEVACNR